MDNLKIISLFSGVGGIDLGFKKAGFFTIFANELDKNAIKTFKLNFPNVEINSKDIRELKKEDILEGADVLLSGFPCQSFSVAGYRRGLEDEKNGDLFFETLRIAKLMDAKVIFMENVKNLLFHDNGKTFEIILDALTKNGYYVKYKVLNTKDYANIPQNRERIYIVAFKDKKAYKNFEFPKPLKLNKSLRDFINFEKIVDDKYYYREESFKYFNVLKEDIKSQDTVYQWRRSYVRENKSGVCPTLTASMGTGGNNVPLIITDAGKIRKLTPRETFNLQGFPGDFKLPEIADSHLYKQAGNSVTVKVIERIAKNIRKVLDFN